MPLNRCRVQRLIFCLEDRLDPLRYGASVGQDPPERCRRLVVFFGDLRTVTFLRNEFLLGSEMVRQQPLQGLDLIQQIKFGRGVVSVISNCLADDVPVLLLHMSAVVLVARP